jgi:hypothetical protein
MKDRDVSVQQRPQRLGRDLHVSESGYVQHVAHLFAISRITFTYASSSFGSAAENARGFSSMTRNSRRASERVSIGHRPSRRARSIITCSQSLPNGRTLPMLRSTNGSCPPISTSTLCLPGLARSPSVPLIRRMAGRRAAEQSAIIQANLREAAGDLYVGAVVAPGEEWIRIRRLPMPG